MTHNDRSKKLDTKEAVESYDEESGEPIRRVNDRACLHCHVDGKSSQIENICLNCSYHGCEEHRKAHSCQYELTMEYLYLLKCNRPVDAKYLKNTAEKRAAFRGVSWQIDVDSVSDEEYTLYWERRQRMSFLRINQGESNE